MAICMTSLNPCENCFMKSFVLDRNTRSYGFLLKWLNFTCEILHKSKCEFYGFPEANTNPTQQQSSLILTLKKNKSLMDKNKNNCCTLIEEWLFVKREDCFFLSCCHAVTSTSFCSSWADERQEVWQFLVCTMLRGSTRVHWWRNRQDAPWGLRFHSTI